MIFRFKCNTCILETEDSMLVHDSLEGGRTGERDEGKERQE
jgi:hypothetical protein